MSLFQDIYKNYGDLDATYEQIQNGFEMPRREDIYNYKADELLNIGAAKQAAVDEHNELLAEKPSSFFGAVGSNWRFNTLTGVAAEKLFEGPQPVDPEFDVTKAVESVKNEFYIPSDLETLSKARNADHFNILVENLKDYQEHRLNMERLGFGTGLAAQLFSEVGNVINWVPFLNITKAGNLLRYKDVVKGMAMQGTVNATEEKLIDEVYNDRGVSDYIAAFAFGAGLSGVVLGSAKLWNTTKFDSGQRIKGEADAFGTYTIKAKADETLAEAKGGPRPDRDWTNSTVLRDDAGELNPEIKTRMEEKGYDPENELDIFVERYESQGLLPRVSKVIQERFGLAGFSQTLAGSESPFFRAIGRAMFEHGEGGLGVHKEHTAALEADLETNRLFSDYANSYRQAKAAFAVEAEQLGIPIKDFDRIAYRYIDGEGTRTFDGALNYPGKTVDKLTDILEDFRKVYDDQDAKLDKHLREAGVPEAERFSEKKSYLNRKYDGEQFIKLTQELGTSKPIKDLIAMSLRKGAGFTNYSKTVLKDIESKYKEALTGFTKKLDSLKADAEVAQMQIDKAKDMTKELQAQVRLEKAVRKIEEHQKTEPTKPDVGEIDTEKVVQRVAEAVYNRMYKRGYEHTADANLLSSNNQTLLLEALEDLKKGGGLDDADIKHIKGILDTAGRDQKGDPTKGRLDMDMGVSKVVNGREIFMTDLLDADLGAGHLATGRYWIGRAAMARKGDLFASEAAIQKSIERASQMSAKMGMEPKEIAKQRQLIERGIELIKGRPIEDMSKPFNVALRNIRKAVVNSSLGQLGIIQASETGRMLAAVDNSMRIPMVRDLVRGVATGKVDSAQLKEIQDHLVGDIGFRRYFNHPDFRADDFGHRVSNFEKMQDKMSYYLGIASGWNRIFRIQNGVLMNGLSQKWYRDVMNGTFKETQMRDLGIDGLMLKDLKTEMTKHATKSEGLDGNMSYTQLGLENWDPRVRRQFALMMHRKASNAIQTIMIGETPMWLNTSMGKFLGQFRTFTIGALSKQTTRDYKMLREGDLEGALALQFNVATSVMANAAKIGFIAATLQGDAREEYLEKNLTPLGFANRALSYTGNLSPLMEVVNTTGDFFFPNKWGEVAGGYIFRGNGLTTMAPGIAFTEQAFRGIRGAMSAPGGNEFTPAEYRALYGLLPFSNNYAFEALNNALVEPNLFKEK